MSQIENTLASIKVDSEKVTPTDFIESLTEIIPSGQTISPILEQPYELSYSFTTVSPTQNKAQEVLEVMNSTPENVQPQRKPKRKRRTQLEMQEARALESSRRLN